MALPSFTLEDLINAGVHYGHKTYRWNPKMGNFIYGVRNGIHIVDLTQTYSMLHRALRAVSDVLSSGGRLLFVGTKQQASQSIIDAATSCAQHHVAHRWLGGMLTNWVTISASIKRLQRLEKTLEEPTGYTKKEVLSMTRDKDRILCSLGGIRTMGGVPNMLFVVDINREKTAILEARRLSIPIVAVVDTNVDPSLIDYPIPGNDDSVRAIKLYCDLIAASALDGIERGASSFSSSAKTNRNDKVSA